MSKEENGTELLNVDEKGETVEKKDDAPATKPNTLALVLMIIFLLIIVLLGGYYTYYQYNRMDQINKEKAKQN